MDRPVAGNVHELRAKTGDTEKITINLGYVDLGHIDLMVQEGFYSNRTDFIRTAIRNQLERHADAVRRSVAHKSLDLGLRHYSRETTKRRVAVRRSISGPRPSRIADDVPRACRATIRSVVVLGALRASPAVKAALAAVSGEGCRRADAAGHRPRQIRQPSSHRNVQLPRGPNSCQPTGLRT
jgi:Arc/MetJ-type ribon-helix-helix transcriptional regulator